MITFKNQFSKNGFMLIEVVIATALLGVGSIAIMNLQATILNQVWQASDRLERIFKLQNLFLDPQLQKVADQDHAQVQLFASHDANDFVNLNYEIVPINRKSELYERFAGVHILRATGAWLSVNREYEESLIGLIYLAPKPTEPEPNLPKNTARDAKAES